MTKTIISEISKREVKVYDMVTLPTNSAEQLFNLMNDVCDEIELCGNPNFTNYRLNQFRWLYFQLEKGLKYQVMVDGIKQVLIKNFPVSVLKIVNKTIDCSYHKSPIYIEYNVYNKK